MHYINTIPVCNKLLALSSFLFAKDTNHLRKDYPCELHVTFASVGLFLCITLCWFILQIVIFLPYGIIKNTNFSEFQQILWDKCFWLSQTSIVSGLSNIMFSESDASKQGFPVVPRQINYSEENKTVLRAKSDFRLCIPELNRGSRGPQFSSDLAKWLQSRSTLHKVIMLSMT